MKFKIIHIILLAIIVALGIFIYTYAIPAGAISLNHIQENDTHIASVNTENLRYPFFGTAFHLHYDPQIYEFTKHTLGDYFTEQDDPIVLVSKGQSPGTLIVGISLKRGQIIDKPNGNLINFYFKKLSAETNENSFGFTHTVFSTFDKEREDIDIDFSTEL